MQNETVSITVANPRSETLLANVKNLLTPAAAMIVDSVEMVEFAKGELVTNKAQAKQLEEARFSITRPLDEAKKNAMAIFKPAEAYLEDESNIIRGKINVYIQEQERTRREEQAKLDAELRAQRMAAEREAALIAAQAKDEADALAEKAKQAQAAGNETLAAELNLQATNVAEAGESDALLAALSVPAVAQVAVTMAKVAGLSVRAPWKGRIVDIIKFIAFVVRNPQYIGLLKIDEAAVNALAKATKGNCNIDGMETYQEQQLAIR